MSNLILASAMMIAMLAPAAAQTSSSGSGPMAPGAVTGSTTATATLTATTRILTVKALEEMDIVGADGKGIGTIDGVVENEADNKRLALVRRGGLLGLGAKELAIPLDNLAVQGRKVTLRNMDTAQLDAIPEHNNDGNTYRRTRRHPADQSAAAAVARPPTRFDRTFSRPHMWRLIQTRSCPTLPVALRPSPRPTRTLNPDNDFPRF